MADPASLAPTVLGGLIAAGIVLAALILALGASTLFVRRFRQSSAADDEDDGRVTSVAITTALGLGLTAALVLVPMDVFLVSAVNDRAVGVRHEWADDAFVRWAQGALASAYHGRIQSSWSSCSSSHPAHHHCQRYTV